MGGIATSMQNNGYIMDIGPHYVTLPNDSEITKNIINIIGTENFEELPHNIRHLRKVFFHGKMWNEFPTINQFLTKLNSKKLLQLAIDLIKMKTKNYLKLYCQKTTKEYLVSNYGNYLYENWFRPYFHNLYFDIEPEKKMVETKFPPVTIKKIFNSISSKNSLTKSNDDEPSYFNCYFKGGMITLINGLKNEIEKHGGKIETSVDIKSIEHQNNNKITYVKKNENFEIESDVIIYALPLNLVQKWFEVKSQLKENSEKDALNSIMVFLFIDSPRVLDKWIVDVYDTDIIFWRVSQQSFLSNTIAPTNKTLLNIEIRVEDESSTWMLNDEVLVDKIKSDLKKIGILKEEEIENYKILRLKNLYPLNQDKTNNNIMKNLINSFDNEYAVGTELDTGTLISEVDEVQTKTFRMGGVLIAMQNAKTLVDNIILKS